MLSFIHNLHLGKKYFSNLFFCQNFFLKTTFFRKLLAETIIGLMIGSQKMSVIKVDQEERLVLMYFLFLIKKYFFNVFSVVKM